MAYFPDNSDYKYLSSDPGGKNVGWLSRDMPFPKGEVPPGFIANLADACFKRGANQTRGFHLCEFCSEGAPQPLLRRRIKKLRLGSREIHIKASDGTIFKAPDLVYHYVKEHGYRPPEAFILALLD